MTRIKVCGLREPEHALVAVAAGADFVGVIFAPMSSRRVTPEQARAVARAVVDYPAEGPRPRVVGIFVNEQPQEINRLADFCGLDLIQLSGDEPWTFGEQIARPVIKALRVPAEQRPADLGAELAGEAPAVYQRQGHLLLESHVAGRFGGTGQSLDWELAAAIGQRFPFFLSGGLRPDNVAQAVLRVRPWGVDVSSGVETGGKKDPDKIRAFIHAVRALDRADTPQAVSP